MYGIPHVMIMEIRTVSYHNYQIVSVNHLPLYMIYTYIFVAVNFYALAQASDFRIERRQVVFSAECRTRTQGLRHQITNRLNAR